MSRKPNWRTYVVKFRRFWLFWRSRFRRMLTRCFRRAYLAWFSIQFLFRLCQETTASSKSALRNVMNELKSTLLQIGQIHQLPCLGFRLEGVRFLAFLINIDA